MPSATEVSNPVKTALEEFEKGFRIHPIKGELTGKQGLQWDFYLGSKKIERKGQSQERGAFDENTIVRVDGIRRVDGKPFSYPDPTPAWAGASPPNSQLNETSDNLSDPNGTIWAVTIGQIGDGVTLDPESNGPTESQLPVAFDPKEIEDTRVRVQALITQRPGQGAFRTALLAAYNHRCAVSGCEITDVLEAAHICPYKGELTNDLTNGLLLRADLHILFDSFLISVHPDDLHVVVAPALLSTAYAVLNGRKLHRPSTQALWPSVKAVRSHFTRGGFGS